jgi:alpha-ketoglutarate-dependent taurine dioxygenase
MKIEPITLALGSRITGIDLRNPISQADWNAIESAWRTSGLLLFPDQYELPFESQVSICDRLAPVVPGSGTQPGNPYERISNVYDKIAPENVLSFHMDYGFLEHPLDGVSLYPLVLPPANCASTNFASNFAPLERMKPMFRRNIERLTVRNVADFTAPKRDIIRYRAGRAPADCAYIERPLVWSHPTYGVPILTCCEQLTERVLELTDDQSVELFDELYQRYLYCEQNVYEHQWAMGDLVIWDNLMIQHARRTAPLSNGERTLRRITMCRESNPEAVVTRYLMSRGLTPRGEVRREVEKADVE